MKKTNKLIIDIPGGFGNQMFGYAFGYVLSQKLNYKYYLHTPFQDSGITWKLQLRYLSLKYDGIITYSWTKNIFDRIIFNKLRRRYRIGIKTKIKRENFVWGMNDYVTHTHGDTMYYGNWENVNFFSEYKDDFIKMYTPNLPRSEDVEEILASIKRSSKATIGVHVRRGDKVGNGSLDLEYYTKAIEEVKKQFGENVCFYVLSDGIDWCKKNLNFGNIEVIYPDYKSDNFVLDDWLILKECNHHIISFSTFSWWAAWLKTSSNHFVVCPENMPYKIESWKAIHYGK